jgi:carboxylesterase type B
MYLIRLIYIQPPEPPYKWRGLIDVTNYGSSCLQYEFLTHFLTGAEDCLNLNVYTHQASFQNLNFIFYLKTLDTVGLENKEKVLKCIA